MRFWQKTTKCFDKRREDTMAVKKTGEKYKCTICGNEVVVTKVGGGTLVCCGKSMEKIEG
jgi:desulfoferrodoxin-like iron-binding protein